MNNMVSRQPGDKSVYCSVFVVLLLSTAVYANIGTPLMWAEAFHLAIGNTLIGVVEGLILAFSFRLNKLRCILLMIPANYFSAWVGDVYVVGAILNFFTFDLYNAWRLIWEVVLLTYLFTLVLEWPFVALCCRGQAKWFIKSIWGTMLTQTVSYILLIVYYLGAGPTTLFTHAQIVKPADLTLPGNVAVYFISDRDGNVYAGPLVNPEERKIYDLKSRDRNDRLIVRRSTSDRDKWDLEARLHKGFSDTPPEMVSIEKSVSSEAAPERDWAQTQPSNEGTWFNFGSAVQLGEAKQSPWEFECGFWAASGLWGENKSSGKHIHLALETPFLAWNVRNVTHLPMDIVLFQLGERQICIFDPKTRKLALIAYGRGPIAVIKEKQ